MEVRKKTPKNLIIINNNMAGKEKILWRYYDKIKAFFVVKIWQREIQAL